VSAESPRRPFPLQRRGVLLLSILAVALWAFLGLELSPGDLAPTEGGLAILKEFAGAAWRPALEHESSPPPGSTPFPLVVLEALRRTLVFAAAGMSLALLLGTALGFLAATAWWSDQTARSGLRDFLARRLGAPSLHVVIRVVIAAMRSVHELLWAVLLLAALGLNSFSAVLAIAIPYGGTLAKVFSEMLDECPRSSARALRLAGASGIQVFLFGLLPHALPDMAAYAFYRFECAVRSSAVLGFFGFSTLGYYLRISFDNQHYREVWSYLWALVFLIVLLELWSGALRRRVIVR
jgi:ABC-type phosphate/phosphonate transport system permease subunit